MKNFRSFFLCVLFLFYGQALSAQVDTAAITGRITDPSKAVIVGADVAAINLATNVRYEGMSNGAGSFVIPVVPQGNYRIEVAKVGFKTIVATGIVLHVQQTIELNFEMALGSASESVTVTDKGTLLNTTDASVSTTVDQQFIQDMPTNGRSLQTVVQLVPGTVLNNAADRGMFNVNGQRTTSNSFVVDGVSGNVSGDYNFGGKEAASGAYPATAVNGVTTSLASIDALQEMTVVTSSGGVDLGHAAGGTVILTTKSGTNEFHGSVYDYLRNTVMDANNWFNNANGLQRPPERQNDFGVAFGGPLRIPGVYNGKDKTFFFFNYEGLRLLTPQTTTKGVAPLPATITSAAPAYQPILEAIAPAPANAVNLGNGFALYPASYDNKNNVDALSLRIDHKVNSNISLFGRYNRAPSSTFTRNAANLAYGVHVQGMLHTLTVGSTQSFSPQVVNQIRFNYSQNDAVDWSYGDNYNGAIPINVASLSSATAGDLTYVAYFNIQVSGGHGSAYVENAHNRTTQRQLEVVDTTSITVGSHHFTAGADIIRIPVLTDSFQNYFYGVANSASLNQGTVSGGFAESYAGAARQTIWRPAVFAGDEWRVTPRLVVNYGVRWEVYPAPHFGVTKPYQIQNVFDPGNATLAPESSFWKTRYGNFGPRVGVAYRLSGLLGRDMVLRAGASEYFDPSALPTGNTATGYPFTSTTTFKSGTAVSQALATQGPPPGTLTTPYSNVTSFDPNLKTPQTWTWNGAIQQSLGDKSYLSVGYLGSAGIYLITPFIYNLQPLNPDFTTATVYTNASHSTYHALQAQYRRTAGPVQVLASYTWSHSIDNASYSLANLGVDGLARGDSDFDARHTFGLVMNYTSPRLENRFLQAIVGRWTLEPHLQMQSALPVDVIGGTVYLSDGSQQTYFAEYLGGAKTISDPAAPGGIRLNPAAFGVPTTPEEANLGRNSVRLRGFWQLDASLSRAIPLSERLRLSLRLDAFNVTNTPQFANVDAFVTDPASLFGRYTATVAQGGGSGALASIYQSGGPRSLQVSLRLQF